MAKAAGTTSTREAAVETRSTDEFATVLKQNFKPRSDRAATEVENAVTTLVREALADTTVIKPRAALSRTDRGRRTMSVAVVEMTAAMKPARECEAMMPANRKPAAAPAQSERPSAIDRVDRFSRLAGAF